MGRSVLIVLMVEQVFTAQRVYALWHDSPYRYILSGIVLAFGCVSVGVRTVSQ